jgi:hypothetical protein
MFLLGPGDADRGLAEEAVTLLVWVLFLEIEGEVEVLLGELLGELLDGIINLGCGVLV